MSNKEDHIDDIFAKGFTGGEGHAPFDESHWDAMEQLLDSEKRRGIIYRFPKYAIGIAALLLLALGYVFLKFEGPANNKVNLAKVKPATDVVIPTDPDSIQKADAHKKSVASKLGDANATNVAPVSPKHVGIKHVNKNYFASPKVGYENMFANKTPAKTGIIKNYTFTPEKSAAMPDQQTVVSNTQEQVAVITKPAESKRDSVINAAANAASAQLPTKTTDSTIRPVKSDKNKLKVAALSPKRPLVISAFVSPDVNYVGGYFSQAKAGANVGLTITAAITPKLSITTGALYAKKPYLVAFSQYKTSYKFATDPNTVYADCRVLDIPVNINYQVYRRGVNFVNLSAGLSSYFMLQENYSYNYSPGVAGPSEYDIRNQNKHLFGVMNISATYRRKVSQRFAIDLQPYMKVPVTDIGYGKVNLQSRGLAVGVSWFMK